jgi:hypothetical protein
MSNLTKESLIEICKKQKINYQEKNNLEQLKNKVLKYSINFLNNNKEKKENNKNKNQEIQITRHARSCNNEGFWKRDPSIINRGIIQTIIFANKNRTKFTSDYVYVSCLLRTWITAILLYSIGQTELILHISPYLKEKHTKFIKHLPNSGKKIDKGNFPESFKTSIRKLLRFLNSVESLLKNKTNLLNNKKNLNFSLPTKIKIIIESKEKHNYLLYIYKNKIINKKFITYPILNDIPIDPIDPIDPILNVRHKTYYQLDGKLGKFLNWVKKKHTLKDKIHVIAHSRLMKEYLVGLDYIDELHKNNFTENNAENNPKSNIKSKNNISNISNISNKANNTNSENNRSFQNTIISTSKFLPINNDENNTDNIDTLNKIQEYISGTNCSMIQLFPDKGCKVSKGYNKTEYTGPEYENYSSVLLGKQKFGYNLCYDKNNKLKKINKYKIFF